MLVQTLLHAQCVLLNKLLQVILNSFQLQLYVPAKMGISSNKIPNYVAQTAPPHSTKIQL